MLRKFDMAIYYGSGDAIDGKKIHLKSKKFVPSGLAMSKTGFKGIKYKCSRDCYFDIVKELEKEIIDKIELEDDGKIHIGLNDCLQCSALYFIADTYKKIDNCLSITMMSGRHECLEGNSNCRVYAEIEYPFEHITRALAKLQIEQGGEHLLSDK